MHATDRRRFLSRAFTVAAAGALPYTPQLLAASPGALPPELVHPDLRGVVPELERRFLGQPGISATTLAAARDGTRNPFLKAPAADIPWSRHEIPGTSGQPPVSVYVVNAKPGQHRPAILHTHGGGFVTGKAADALFDLQAICRELDCVAVSVDYRLAPETTYAGSIEDNYAGLRWLHNNAAELGVDPARIAVMGESAGGGHAALLAITARDRGEVPVCFQCLIYPMLDDRTGSSRMPPKHVGTLIWTADSNRFGWQSFLGQPPGSRRVPKAAVPARVDDLSGLPPAFIAVGTLDLFCDEDIDYAQRLNAAGALTELIVVPGAFHGFDGISLMMGAPLGEWFRTTKMNALRRGLGLPVASSKVAVSSPSTPPTEA